MNSNTITIIFVRSSVAMVNSVQICYNMIQRAFFTEPAYSVGTSRSVLKVSEKSLDVHIFSDQSSLEIFTDQYRNNHSNNIFAGNDQDAISISAFGGRAVIRDYEAYGLQECFN